MARYGFRSRIDPAQVPEYRRRHGAVWPELLVALRDAGWRNYSIFVGDDGALIGFFEAEDKDAAQAAVAATAVNERWQREMAALFVGDGNPDEGFTFLPEAFNLDDQLLAAGLDASADLRAAAVDPGAAAGPETAVTEQPAAPPDTVSVAPPDTASAAPPDTASAAPPSIARGTAPTTHPTATPRTDQP